LLAATSLLRHCATTLTSSLERFPTYSLVLCGHSLGAGVAMLCAIILLSDLKSSPLQLTPAQRDSLRCYGCAMHQRTRSHFNIASHLLLDIVVILFSF
jgi:hypothetical protein